MLIDKILLHANQAYHERRLDDWRAWHALLSLLRFLSPDSQIVALKCLEQASKE